MPKINDFIINNMIYCEDTHSFVHRLYDMWKKKMPESYRDAQNDAWDVVNWMNNEEMNDGEKREYPCEFVNDYEEGYDDSYNRWYRFWYGFLIGMAICCVIWIGLIRLIIHNF
jgi:hypothetical protein